MAVLMSPLADEEQTTSASQSADVVMAPCATVVQAADAARTICVDRAAVQATASEAWQL